MTRTLCVACLASFLLSPAVFPQTKDNSQQQGEQKKSPPQAAPTAPQAQNPPEEAIPPEEDESVAPEKFALDPLESDRNIKVGNYYWRKGNYRAALGRYERATRFNPSSAEAFFKVGEAEEKLKNRDAARTAFQRVIQVAPDSKLAQEAKKKLSSKG